MKWPPDRMFSDAPGIRSASRCGQLGLTSWSSVPVQTSTGTTRSSGSLRRTPHHTEALTRQPRNVLRHSGIHPIHHRKFVVHARIRKRQRARDDRHSCYSMPQRVTDCCGVLAAHRPAHDGEPVDVELVEQFPDIARPVQDRAIGQRIGQPDAGRSGEMSLIPASPAAGAAASTSRRHARPPCALTTGNPIGSPYCAYPIALPSRSRAT
jgi:hypothetical protein